MYFRPGLMLTVTRAGNLRCDYCYERRGTRPVMPTGVARRAVQRGVASLVLGGTMKPGFFGGELPLVADLVGDRIVGTRNQARLNARARVRGPGYEATRPPMTKEHTHA